MKTRECWVFWDWSCRWLCECQEWNPGPLKEQPELCIAESSPQAAPVSMLNPSLAVVCICKDFLGNFVHQEVSGKALQTSFCVVARGISEEFRLDSGPLPLLSIEDIV